MKRYRIPLLLLCAALLGAVAVAAVPEAAVPAVVLAPLFACIILGWALAIQNGGLNTSLSGIIFPVKPLTKVQPSQTLLALSLSAGFAVGACIALLLFVGFA